MMCPVFCGIMTIMAGSEDISGQFESITVSRFTFSCGWCVVRKKDLNNSMINHREFRLPLETLGEDTSMEFDQFVQ